MINITYAALHMRAQTEKTTFSCKDDCTLTRFRDSALPYTAVAVIFYSRPDVCNNPQENITFIYIGQHIYCVREKDKDKKGGLN